MYNVLFLPDLKIWGGGYGSQLSEVQIDTRYLYTHQYDQLNLTACTNYFWGLDITTPLPLPLRNQNRPPLFGLPLFWVPMHT